jgi:hypothetical protein
MTEGFTNRSLAGAQIMGHPCFDDPGSRLEVAVSDPAEDHVLYLN